MALALALGLAARLGAAELPPAPPIHLWGELQGPALPGLEAVLTDPAGQQSVAASVTTSQSEGHTGYAVAFNGDEVARALGSGRKLLLSFRSGETRTAEPLALELPVPSPIHVRGVTPARPDAWVVTARAEQARSGPGAPIELTALFANAAAAAQDGTVKWTADDPPRRTLEAPLALAPGVTVSRLNLAPAGEAHELHWTVTWRAKDAERPLVHGRAALREDTLTLVDQEARGPALAAAPDVTAAENGDVPLVGPQELAVGQCLALEAQSSLSDPAAVRAELAGWAVVPATSLSGPVPIQLMLDEVATMPLPGGGSWVRAQWVIPAAGRVAELVVRGDHGRPAAGTWKLRNVSTFFVVQPGETY